jgi:hypothetical protein
MLGARYTNKVYTPTNLVFDIEIIDKRKILGNKSLFFGRIQ